MSSRRGRSNFWRGHRQRGHNNSSRNSQCGPSSCSRTGQILPAQNGCISQVQHRRPRQVQTSLISCPFKKWSLYFPDCEYNPESSLGLKVQAIVKFVESNSSQLCKDEIESKGAMVFDYGDLICDPELCEDFPSLATDLREEPTVILQSLGLAVSQVLLSAVSGESQQVACLVDLPYIQARISNFEPVTPLKSLRSNYCGKFVTIHGTVVRVSNVKPLVMGMAFSCNLCGETQAIHLTDGKYSVPSKCSSSDCRGQSFNPERSSSLTETMDWQNIRVQEIMDDDQRESGRIPRTVEVELTADLVDSCVPGDMVTITGFVKVSSSEEHRNKNNKDKCMFVIYIHANAVNNNKGNAGSGEQTSGLAMDFSIKELYAIQEIQAQSNLFRLIVGSLCPSIYGHEMVKAGLVLGLFGGTQRYVNDKNRIPIRGNPHVLVVGDPGLGKSQMLQAVSNIAPRGVYVCGNATSTSGLTEQQSISIAKAGIVCSLPARTSILAAANPVGGHYNKAKTVSENLKRQRLAVFILLDKPDEEMDSMLSEHVMALHAGKKSAFGVATARRRSREESGSDEDVNRRQWEADKPLSERLKVNCGVMIDKKISMLKYLPDFVGSYRSTCALSIGRNEEFDAIPAPLLRKYVGYARTYVNPKLTPAAAEVLQARARLEMREKASQQDAQDVVEIMKYSLLDAFSDDLGNLDFQRSQHGSGMSSRAQSKRFVAELSRVSEREYNSLFTVDQMRGIAKDLRLRIRNFEDFVYSLNNQGFLLKKGPRVYQLQTSSCL
ncbi:DNA helicase MCM8 [Acropora cervicornis]|uniref:DNA helicase MCM8 n=1 Tax=Acropora cervicornis TaxID=6130 RepID=A0AAD9QTX3_ACRCE|nr:DNA helicase MCM8 [Acropora cervicornis]